jgi:hypothetical protein
MFKIAAHFLLAICLCPVDNPRGYALPRSHGNAVRVRPTSVQLNRRHGVDLARRGARAAGIHGCRYYRTQQRAPATPPTNSIINDLDALSSCPVGRRDSMTKSRLIRVFYQGWLPAWQDSVDARRRRDPAPGACYSPKLVSTRRCNDSTGSRLLFRFAD